MTSKEIKTTVHDCTIIKLGGSWAISLQKSKLEKEGFSLGLPITAELSFDFDRDLEPIEDYTEQIKDWNKLISEYNTWEEEDVEGIREELGLIKWREEEETIEQYKEALLIELKAQVKYFEKMQKENEELLNSPEPTEDDFDYDKSKEKTIGLTEE